MTRVWWNDPRRSQPGHWLISANATAPRPLNWCCIWNVKKWIAVSGYVREGRYEWWGDGVSDRQNHDPDVRSIGATIDRHGRLLHEILCRLENCKVCYHPGLFGIEWFPILDHNLNISVAMSCLLIFATYLECCADCFWTGWKAVVEKRDCSNPNVYIDVFSESSFDPGF